MSNHENLNIEIHHKYGFYKANDNGIKCEFMELEGYYMRCNKDLGIFKKNEMYLIYGNSNNEILYDNSQTENIVPENKEDYFKKYNSMEIVNVEKFEDGTFTLIPKLEYEIAKYNE